MDRQTGRPAGDRRSRHRSEGKAGNPGFVDCHMHPTILADCYKKISCLPPKINSIEELIEAIREERSNLDGRAWIEGWGYDEGKLKEHRRAKPL